MWSPKDFHRKTLKLELEARRRRNPRYSLRAFARDLEIDASFLSQVLTGKKQISTRQAMNIAKKIELPDGQRSLFLDAALRALETRRATASMTSADAGEFAPLEPASLDAAVYAVLKRWYFSAIMELTQVTDFKDDPRWIAEQLGIKVTEARAALARLLQIGVLQRTPTGIKKPHRHTTTTDKHKTAHYLQALQIQFLELAIESIKRDPITVRDASALTMAIAPEKVETAKQMIQDFRFELCKFLESGERKSLYQLCINLFPLRGS